MKDGGTAALIVAAGRGQRVAGGGLPKQFRHVGGRPVLGRSIDLFALHPSVDVVLVVIGEDVLPAYRDVAPQSDRLLAPVIGGATRQESVRRGLAGLSAYRPRYVLIHDAARPFASPALVDRVLLGLADATAVVPALPVTSTIKSVDREGFVTSTVPRGPLRAVETPQGFVFDVILSAHDRAAAANIAATDDGSIAEWAGIPVLIVAGERENIKLTVAEDLEMADRRLLGEEALRLGDVRVGTGYDVHAFGPGVCVMLGGVAIPHGRGVLGHSDADVALHALTDAVLGALAEGDIGDHFPPTDPRWKDVASDQFLRFACERVAARGGRIANLDLAIIAEAPRIADHRASMKSRIAAICGVSPDRVGIKATTNENLGFIGRGEGIAAIATATIRLPFRPAS